MISYNGFKKAFRKIIIIINVLSRADIHKKKLLIILFSIERITLIKQISIL